MSPPRPRRRRGAFVLLVAACFASPAPAQMLEDVPPGLGASFDPLHRSARPVGMGRLTLVLPDGNNRITMWDFAGNPTGVLEADSLSTFELRPGGWTTSSARNAEDASGTFERQDYAGNRARIGFEGWRRSGGNTVFGGIGEAATTRTDLPYDLESERRTVLSRPSGTVVLNGRMPYFLTESMRYALRASLTSERSEDEYRLIQRNAAGQYLNQSGLLIGPPNRFDPDEVHVRSVGVGVALSYRFAPWLTFATGSDFRMDKLRSQNEGDRYLSEYEEDRPFAIGQATLIGQFRGLEYGADARAWNGKSDATYVFTGSAGIGAVPIIGRGNLYDREERGSLIRARSRWTRGPLELGASFRHAYGKYEITPPPFSDGTSLNAYLRDLFADPRADSIGLRDSVRHEIRERRAVEMVAGAAWRLPRPGAAIGVESHVWTDELDQLEGGEGPNAAGWDVRAGLEWPCTSVLTGRAGYIYRSEDLDDLTDANEYASHAVTAGVGYQPPQARWRFESGYAFEWGQADFGAPDQPRFTRQQLATQLRWLF